MERSAEGFGELVVTGGEATKLFELVEEALDAIAFPVKLLVIGEFAGSRGDRRNDRGDPIIGQTLSNAISVVAFIERGRLQDVVRVEALVEAFELSAVVGMSGGEMQSHGAILIEGGGMDLGAQPTARASQSLVAAVFFGAPAAC